MSVTGSTAVEFATTTALQEQIADRIRAVHEQAMGALEKVARHVRAHDTKSDTANLSMTVLSLRVRLKEGALVL